MVKNDQIRKKPLLLKTWYENLIVNVVCNGQKNFAKLKYYLTSRVVIN